MKDREHTLEKSKHLLMKENKELREKAESLKSHSSKFNLCVFRLPTTSWCLSLMSCLGTKRRISWNLPTELDQKTKFGCRVMIVRIQRYVVKKSILKIAKENMMVRSFIRNTP